MALASDTFTISDSSIELPHPSGMTANQWRWYSVDIGTDQEKKSMSDDMTPEERAKQLEKEARAIRRREKQRKRAAKRAAREARERTAIKEQAVADLRAISAQRKSYRSVCAAEALLKMTGDLPA